MIKLKIKRLDGEMPMPAYAYAGDAAFDLYAKEKTILKPGERKAVPTGIMMEIPEGYVGLVWDKSSVGIKGGIKTLGGVIDCGYRGEVLIGLINLSQEEYVFEKGHKLAQMIIQKKETVEIEEVDELADSHRGEGGFGSSGK
jgi:dUTP pyrophosphatase